MDTKKPWESKTIVISSLLAIIAILSKFVPQLGVVHDYVNANGMIITLAWSALAVALRLLTKDKIVLGE